MVYGTYNYSIHGGYKPSNITGGPHIVWFNIWDIYRLTIYWIFNLLDIIYY